MPSNQAFQWVTAANSTSVASAASEVGTQILHRIVQWPAPSIQQKQPFDTAKTSILPDRAGFMAGQKIR